MFISGKSEKNSPVYAGLFPIVRGMENHADLSL